MDKWAVVIDGLSSLAEFDSMKEDVVRVARLAINKAADRARARSATRIRQQVNFPVNYLSPSEKRLYVAQYASESDLEARVRGRSRPTSLATFVRGATTTPGKEGVIVEVHPGKARQLRRAFLMKLRRGTGDIDTAHNMGLAVRLKPGETLRNKSQVVRVASNLYLLYGPSVQQVFMANDGTGVAEDVSPEITDFLTNEYYRLWSLRHG